MKKKISTIAVVSITYGKPDGVTARRAASHDDALMMLWWCSWFDDDEKCCWKALFKSNRQQTTNLWSFPLAHVGHCGDFPPGDHEGVAEFDRGSLILRSGSCKTHIPASVSCLCFWNLGVKLWARGLDLARSVIRFDPRCNTTSLLEPTCRYHTAHAPLIRKISEFSAGILVPQPGQDVHGRILLWLQFNSILSVCNIKLFKIRY